MIISLDCLACEQPFAPISACESVCHDCQDALAWFDNLTYEMSMEE